VCAKVLRTVLQLQGWVVGLIVKVEKHAVFRGYVFIIEVVEASAMHEVSDVIIDGKSLKEEAGRKTIHLSGSCGGTHNR